MFIFAWVLLVLASFTIIMEFVDTVKGVGRWRLFFSNLIAIVLWIFGCVWYIFDFTFLPEELAIGMAFGGAVLAFIDMIASWIRSGFRLTLEEFTNLTALTFFTLAAVQHVWPYLVTF